MLGESVIIFGVTSSINLSLL